MHVDCQTSVLTEDILSNGPIPVLPDGRQLYHVVHLLTMIFFAIRRTEG